MMQDALDAQPLSPANGRGVLLSVVLVSLIGLGASIYLSIQHWQIHNLPGHVSFCAISETVNCDTVSLSRFSMIGRVPVSTWGILFYLLVAGLGVWGLSGRQKTWPFGLIGLMYAIAVGLSAFLFVVSELIVQAFCIICLSLYLVNVAGATLWVFGQRRVGVPAAAAAVVPLLAPAVAIGIFAGWFPAAASRSLVFLLCASVFWVALGVSLVKAKRRGLRVLVARLGSDLAHPFRRPLVGGGLSALVVLALAVLVAVSPRCYPGPDREIAGGILDLATGRTAEGHNWIGAGHPEVVITEYSDYECPFCRKAHEVVRQVVREKKDWLRLVHVHVPLDHSCNPLLKEPFHLHACDCARAAICADRQSRFWEMNDALFIRRGGLDAGGLTMLAESIGLDLEGFRSCMKSLDTERMLQADLHECRGVAEECREMGKRFGTPTFTVQGHVVVGHQTKAFWVQLVERLRQKGG